MGCINDAILMMEFDLARRKIIPKTSPMAIKILAILIFLHAEVILAAQSIDIDTKPSSHPVQ